MIYWIYVDICEYMNGAISEVNNLSKLQLIPSKPLLVTGFKIFTNLNYFLSGGWFQKNTIFCFEWVYWGDVFMVRVWIFSAILIPILVKKSLKWSGISVESVILFTSLSLKKSGSLVWLFLPRRLFSAFQVSFHV